MLMRNIKTVLNQTLRPVISIPLTTMTANPAITTKINKMILITIFTITSKIPPAFILTKKHLLNFSNLNIPKNKPMTIQKPFPMLCEQIVHTERIIIQ